MAAANPQLLDFAGGGPFHPPFPLTRRLTARTERFIVGTLTVKQAWQQN